MEKNVFCRFFYYVNREKEDRLKDTNCNVHDMEGPICIDKLEIIFVICMIKFYM